MLRLVALVSLVLSTMVFAPVAAAAECALCLDSVTLQTRDGQRWTAGKPVTLVVRVTDPAAAALPSSAQVVVMQTDGDRTKCLGVPLKLVQSDASGALYAGVFFPFRPARYDGTLSIAGEIQPITFDVNQIAAGVAPAGELPAAEPIDTAAPPLISVSAPELPAIGIAAVALWAMLVLALYAQQRRVPRPA